MNKYTEANKRLAIAKGWIDIVEVGGALLGTPPDGAPGSRGQAMVPDWCGDWKECGTLLKECDVKWFKDFVLARGVHYGKKRIAFYADHEGSDLAAVLYVMCGVHAEELEYAK